MYNFTIPMALMDYLPVIFFGITAVILLRDLYNKMSKGAYALLAAGSVNVFIAGFCKATWKLLYAANICGFGNDVSAAQLFGAAAHGTKHGRNAVPETQRLCDECCPCSIYEQCTLHYHDGRRLGRYMCGT